MLAIDDEEMSNAVKDFLRRIGARNYKSQEEYETERDTYYLGKKDSH
jgi:hypothetical protein